MQRTKFKKQFIGLILLISAIFGNFSAFAQTKSAASSTPPKTQTANNEKKQCNSGYTGSVNYTQTLTDSYGDPESGSSRSKNKVFTVNIPIRDDSRQTADVKMSPYDGTITGSFNFKSRATAKLDDENIFIDKSAGNEVCTVTMRGETKEKAFSCTGTTNIREQATGEGEVTVYLGLRGDKLTISSDIPRITGQRTQTNSSGNCTGGCQKREPINSSSSSAINEKPRGFYTADATFNLQGFNRLNGTYTKTSGKTVETITWNLSRCAPTLRIENVTFAHHEVPDPTTWRGVDSKRGTTDGNRVRVRAKVFNGGGDTAYANVKFSETTSSVNLPDNTISAAIKPGESRDVEYEWDTSGFAWDENKRAKMEREIKAEIEGDAQTAKIKIKPKPVVMVHGLWSNEQGWASYPAYLRNAHSNDWNGYAVGADPEHGKMNTGDHPGNYKPTNTIFQNSQELGKQIKHVRKRDNAWHVDIVAHSMGGLISRHYINTFMAPVYDGKPEVSHLVMLGTPNQGSPCAYLVDGIFSFFDNNEMMAMKELRPDSVGKFNSINTNRKGVKFSVLIGVIMPRTCQAENLWGDGVVPIGSAKHNLTDVRYVMRAHTELTGKEDFEKFVLPRLAVGPKKAQADQQTAWLETIDENNLARRNAAEFVDRNGFSSYFQNASLERNAENESPQDDADASLENVTTRQKVVLNAKQTKEIEIPVRDGKQAGVLLVASTAVAGTLFDETGAQIGKNIVDSPDAPRELFRVINADRLIKNGVWKIKLENYDTKEQTVYLAGWTNNGATSSFTVEAGKPNAAGTVPLTAKIIENNQPVLNTKITGRIAEHAAEIQFHDDGKHGDGAANDGVYGGAVEKLAKGEYFIEANATMANSITKTAVAPLVISTPSLPTKPVRRGK